MIAAVLMVAIHSAVFVKQDLDIQIPRSQEPVSDKYVRYVDLDRDGLNDILTRESLVPQVDGRFANDRVHPLPTFEGRGAADIWEGELYVRFASALSVLRWKDGKWERILQQEIAFPPETPTGMGDDRDPAVQSPLHHFERFLYDLDGDDRPEIVLPSENGLAVFARKGPFFAPAGVLRYNAQPAVLPMDALLWPEARRRIALPVVAFTHRFAIEGNHVLLLRDQIFDHMQGQSRWVLEQYDILSGEEYSLSADGTVLSESNPVRGLPVFLNKDEHVDFIADEVSYNTDKATPTPTFSVHVSTNGGRSFDTIRNTSLSTAPAFGDMNGDGRQDLIVDRTTLFDAGLRETFLRVMTRSQLEHEVRIHFQSKTGSFAQSPDVTRTFTLELGKPIVQPSPMQQRYTSGRLFDYRGDFDGDGRNDVLVQERPTRLSVYLMTDSGLSGKPYATVDSTEITDFGVCDLDGDGRSDLVVGVCDSEAGDEIFRSVVYLTRDNAP
ncbi:MAG: hypothetical protein AMXMBFR82_11460 [Candidatus Hydrogenedentota bacterium]